MVFIVRLHRPNAQPEKILFSLHKTPFQRYKISSTPFLFSSAKKCEKLYLFMGRANKITTARVNK
jgi:hypothetical protein